MKNSLKTALAKPLTPGENAIMEIIICVLVPLLVFGGAAWIVWKS